MCASARIFRSANSLGHKTPHTLAHALRLQAVAFFILVLLAPGEDGAESVWVGLSVSCMLFHVTAVSPLADSSVADALLITAFVQLFQGQLKYLYHLQDLY